MWIEVELRPSILNVYITLQQSNMIKCLNLIDYATQRINIPTCTTAIFRLYDDRVPLNFSPALPYIQLHFERSGQVTTPGVKLSILHNDVV